MALSRKILVTVVFEPSHRGEHVLAQAYQCALPVVRRPVPRRGPAESEERPDVAAAGPRRIGSRRG